MTEAIAISPGKLKIKGLEKCIIGRIKSASTDKDKIELFERVQEYISSRLKEMVVGVDITENKITDYLDTIISEISQSGAYSDVHLNTGRLIKRNRHPIRTDSQGRCSAYATISATIDGCSRALLRVGGLYSPFR